MPADRPSVRPAAVPDTSGPMLRLRGAKPDDAEAIWALAAPYAPEDQALTGVEATVLRKQMNHGLAVGAVCERPESGPFGRLSGPWIVGAVLVKPGDGYVWMLYVHKRWQLRGIGRKLLQTGLEVMRREGRDEITLRVPSGAPAEGFYRHLGWARMHTANGGRHEVYRIDLPSPTGR